jgi:hypothetical protein
MSDEMKTRQTDPTIKLAAQRIAYWDPRSYDWAWRGEPVEPDWADPAAEWDAIVLAAGKQKVLLVADDDDPKYEQMLVELWMQGYVVVDSRDALSLLPLWAEIIFEGNAGTVRRMKMFQA